MTAQNHDPKSLAQQAIASHVTRWRCEIMWRRSHASIIGVYAMDWAGTFSCCCECRQIINITLKRLTCSRCGSAGQATEFRPRWSTIKTSNPKWNNRRPNPHSFSGRQYALLGKILSWCKSAGKPSARNVIHTSKSCFHLLKPETNKWSMVSINVFFFPVFVAEIG